MRKPGRSLHSYVMWLSFHQLTYAHLECEEMITLRPYKTFWGITMRDCGGSSNWNEKQCRFQSWRPKNNIASNVAATKLPANQNRGRKKSTLPKKQDISYAWYNKYWTTRGEGKIRGYASSIFFFFLTWACGAWVCLGEGKPSRTDYTGTSSHCGKPEYAFGSDYTPQTPTWWKWEAVKRVHGFWTGMEKKRDDGQQQRLDSHSINPLQSWLQCDMHYTSIHIMEDRYLNKSMLICISFYDCARFEWEGTRTANG